LEKSNDYDMGTAGERHNTSASNFSSKYLLRKLYLEDTGMHGWEMSKSILRACVDNKGEPATRGSRQGQYGANVNVVMNLLFS